MTERQIKPVLGSKPLQQPFRAASSLVIAIGGHHHDFADPGDAA